MSSIDDGISFVSRIPGLYDIEECRPKPVSKFIPDWWKEMELKTNSLSLNETNFGNAKICPSFADYFSNGYIMPMWTDTIIYYDSDTNEYKWRTSSDKFEWSYHSNDQYLKHVDHKFLGKKSYFIFKIECPWLVLSKEKYSMYQLPVFFDFNEDYSAFPGVRDVSVYNVMNIQLLIHSDKKEIFIERGTPIAHFIPFKKNAIPVDIRDATEEDYKKINKFDLNAETKFFSTYRIDKRTT